MRAADWINTLAFGFLTILAWGRRLDARRRAKATAIGAMGLGATALGAFVLPRLLSPLAASVTRDWLPYVLLLLFYWQAGQFFTRVDAAFQRRLERLDQRMVARLLAWCPRQRAGRWILTVLELAYLFCYASLPLGLAAMYLMRRGHEADRFWTVVLGATYACYALLPFIQTKPPRMLQEPWDAEPPPSPVRRLNLWVLRHASIQANTFPSAHGASSMACALVLLRLAPWVGLAFLLLAVCIALGAVAGRYHYAADVILGALVALAVFLAETRWAGMAV